MAPRYDACCHVEDVGCPRGMGWSGTGIHSLAEGASHLCSQGWAGCSAPTPVLDSVAVVVDRVLGMCTGGESVSRCQIELARAEMNLISLNLHSSFSTCKSTPAAELQTSHVLIVSPLEGGGSSSVPGAATPTSSSSTTPTAYVFS